MRFFASRRYTSDKIEAKQFSLKGRTCILFYIIFILFLHFVEDKPIYFQQ